MNSLNTPEEKLAALCIKYADVLEENTKLKVNQINKILYLKFVNFLSIYYRLLTNNLKKEYLKHLLSVIQLEAILTRQ